MYKRQKGTFFTKPALARIDVAAPLTPIVKKFQISIPVKRKSPKKGTRDRNKMCIRDRACPAQPEVVEATVRDEYLEGVDPEIEREISGEVRELLDEPLHFGAASTDFVHRHLMPSRSYLDDC